MKSVGEILKKTRLAQEISLSSVEAATKIRQEYLTALEENAWQRLPSIASTRGFIKNYAEFLKLDPQNLLVVFRRDFKQKTFPSPLRQTKPQWTPKMTIIAVVAMVFLGLTGYLSYQYFSLVKEPFLVVNFPQDGEQVDQFEIEIQGLVKPDTLVTVNDRSVSVTADGQFHYRLVLFSGENQIVIEATSRLGKKSRLVRKVFYIDTER